MAGMPGILCQPAFQALSGRVSQVLHDLGRGHRRGGMQVHRALSFPGAEHVIIPSFSLQENVYSPLPRQQPDGPRLELRRASYALCHGSIISHRVRENAEQRSGHIIIH